MIALLFLNMFLIVLAAVLPNDFLAMHSYVLYGVQLLTMIPFLLSRTVYMKNLFMPTFFVLFYFLVNLTFGSYLVPREYGWEKQFAAVSLASQNYNLIVPFLLASNIILFWLTASTLRKLMLTDAENRVRMRNEAVPVAAAGVAKSLLYFALYFAVAYFDVYSAFSFMLVILILHGTDPWLKRSSLRYGAYAFYLAVIAAFDYDNKREIAMALFVLIFLEAYHRRTILRFTPQAIVTYMLSAVSFFGLVLTASILRGYGDFPVASLIDAVSYIPQYMSSDTFIDGITDNLELNYNYGVTVTAMDQGLRGLIDYQWGASLYKVFFLPIPRDVLPYKPESMMQLFTRIYAPDWWAAEASMPVMFAADMFLNFSFLGLIAYALVWMGINKLFVIFHSAKPRSFVACSCVFLFITILMFARGAGLEQWLLYLLLAVPVFLVVKLAGNGLQAGRAPELRWVV